MLFEEGLENVFKRHHRIAEGVRKAVIEGWGLKLCAQDEYWHSDTVTAIVVPEDKDAKEVISTAFNKYHLSLGAGLTQKVPVSKEEGDLADKYKTETGQQIEEMSTDEIKKLGRNLTEREICSKYYEIHKKVYQWFNIDFDYFGRTTTDNQADKNWGLYRHLFKDWQADQAASNTFSGDYTYTLDGTGVDIVIQDDGVDPTGHPEWEDYNGTTRFQQLDWYAASGVSGTMPTNHYTNITNDSNRAGAHGSHCCGIAAGKTYGWAKNAQLFSVRLFGGAAAMSLSLIHISEPTRPY